ncbi:hypothetical protein CAEBREN_23586 [Caenorhabditis brenneri]|uniref:DUF7627 domain-containing protein n=1 Tax=Caenorhabditis brenneri TaxID=135651 RepID=G0MGA3_CAEBE|nr:hypothetical protein CAEBREN_23586 [Caenorhabditis brenneri]
MSRLAGRVTFPGAAPATENPSYSSDRVEIQDARRAGNNNRNHRNQDEVRPRGRGNVRYQGNYSDRFQTQDRSEDVDRSDRGQRYQQFDRQGPRSDRPQKFDRSDRSDRFQKPQGGSYRSDRGFDRSERPPRSDRSDRSDRSPTDSQTQNQKPSHHRKPTQKMEDVMPSEELLELEDIIAQISDLNIRNDRSAAQIKNEIFSAVMSDELMNASSQHVMENDDKPIPALLSAILCAHWPRQYAKAFSNVNPILYNVVCIVKGWIEVVKEDTENFHKEEPKPKYQGREDPDDTPENEVAPEEEKEKVIEDPVLVNKCAVALSDLCDTAQRQLWVNWMQVTDEIYTCIKPTITHNPNITGDVKARLLDTFIQMNQWTKTRQPGVKHAGVQTVSTGSN